MLGFFSGSKSDHPLADAKQAKQIAAEIVRLEAAKGIDEATGWFESLAGVPEFSPSLRLERTLEIAAASIAHTRRQSRDYLAEEGSTTRTRQQLWQRNHGYWVRLEEALQRCLADDVPGKTGLGEAMPLALTNLLAALGMELRWIQLRHGPVSREIWGRLGQAYLRAIAAQVAELRVNALGSGDTGTSATREYLKALVFQASSLDNLRPLEVAIAERLITAFLPRFALGGEAVAGCVYWVDAGCDAPPARLTQLPAAAPGLRFISPGSGLPDMQQLRQQIAATRILPRDIAGAEEFPAEAVLRVLDHLILCWSPKPPLRKNARHRIASDVYVVRGLDRVLWYLSGGGNSLDEVETWTVDDVSQGGMGVNLPLKMNEIIPVGTLVGCQPAGVAAWQLGVIRRFSRSSEQRGTAGIETLSKTSRTLSVMDSGLKTELILLDALKDDSSVRILLGPSYWEAGTAFVTLVDGRPWRLHADEPLDQAGDWLLGRCIAEELRD